MLEALRFVQGAIARKDYQPALTHFQISGGRILGFNGTLALSSPIALNITAVPKAIPFVRAVENCVDNQVVIHMTAGGRLAVKSGDFRAYIECYEDAEIFEQIKPAGTVVSAIPLLDALRALEPFIGIDASRPWATGILLRNQSAYATNNIILAEYWLGVPVPIPVNIPGAAVREMIRIGVEPIQLSIAENSITLHYADDRWLRAQLLQADWPDLDKILSLPCNPKPLPAGFFEALGKLAPFVDELGRIYFRGNTVCTSIGDEDGAAITLANALPEHGVFSHKYLSLLDGIATHIDFAQHPKPCGFRGKMLRGVLLGLYD